MAPSFIKLGFFSISFFRIVTSAPNIDIGSHSLDARVLAKRDLLTATTGLPGQWSLQGCYLDDTATGRTLQGAAYTSGTAMTEEACVMFCDTQGFDYAGVEYSQECYCGSSLSTNTTAPITDCNMPCTGNATEACGGGNRLNLFWSGKMPPPAPTTNPGPTGWSLLGCYTEGNNGRLLTTPMNVAGGAAAMSVAACTYACGQSSYMYSGVEYAQECYCGNQLSNGGVIAPNGLSDCNMLCKGNSSEYCGAGNRLDVYTAGPASPSVMTTQATIATTALAVQTGPVHVQSVGGFNWIGCYTESTQPRALRDKTTDDYAAMTIETCQGLCSTYTYFGVEYGGECYCGNVLQPGAILAAPTDCSFLCPGNSNEYCGAGNRLDLYQVGSGGPSTLATTSQLTSQLTSIRGITTTSQSSAATGLPTGWNYASCYAEPAGARALTQAQPDNQQNTVEACVNTCQAAGYTVAGVEYGVQCFCDNSIHGGAAVAPETDCSTPCPGNAAEMCGAGNRLNVYYTGTLKTYAAPAAQTSGIPGSWTYEGCFTDNVNGVRALKWQVILPQNNSATNCLGLCAEFGYMAGGMEYGEECYCGDDDYRIAQGSTQVAETECNQICSGDPNYVCGQGNLLSYYRWTGTPLYNWATPTGNAAGSYDFFVPGVVVPLMTSVTIKGKVTFLEKSGTGAPNTTGAYELDLTEVNNFPQAWRTMHVKTDIFCSGGLTLPDKGGRQLTIGGWSGESTFGVRLYWPDGSDGVPGTRDWQEDVNTVSLQTGRWYPSTMLLSNGSILVMGGEVGSNAAANPTLEVLPKPAGGYIKYLDWLQRTDPNNLYPFLFVLPGGGIFVGYWNEARILDPVTFDTVTILPNIPGAVNDFLGGRTYPLEGTAVLLPQSAANGWAATILICGGSTQYSAEALDNCVSIKPEDANPVWIIERMPSQRVMSCIAPLPDGTYLINNGAHVGVAGFGLASSPNLNAILYDPSKPVNSRISIMASTIVARLYHSESILLPDGGVLVSGSDPQDGVNPEEYRVEKFSPPYLLSGAAKPSFTITNTDWAYGQNYQITVTIPSGNMATVKISLMGAVSSTHGNSMGQKTLFPAFLCVGNICTITAPPNNRVSPPGWFQVFVLDGPTPSHSQWVRIGGDPGQLGNWPANNPAFTVPGI